MFDLLYDKFMSKKMDLIYRLEGPDIEKGIDVFELAPMLLSIGELIKESNKTLNPEGKEIAINVKPFDKGSFIVDILLFSQTNLQQLLEFIQDTSAEDIENLKEALRVLGIIAGGLVPYTLIKLIKFLKGKTPIKIEKIGPNEFRFFSNDTNSVTVNLKVNKLYLNPKIQQNIYKVYGVPFEKEGIDKIESYLPEDIENTKVEIEKKEFPYFKTYANSEILGVSEIVENTSIVFLNPKRGSYEGERTSWSFRKGNNREDIIRVTNIRDEGFLSQIKEGEIRLHHGDLLKVELLEKQKIVGQIVQSITYEILKVLEYKKAPEQKSLLEDEESE